MACLAKYAMEFPKFNDEPPCDPYGTKLINLRAHVGTLYQQIAGLKAELMEQRDILMAAMQMIVADEAA